MLSFVFFFKQKTAYEMRISDWSSDVCSSDLCDEEIAAYQAGEPEREAKKANEETRTKRHRAERSELFKVLTDAGQHAPWNINIKEIGRASCRARVCQYV